MITLIFLWSILYNNIPASPADGVYVSLLIRYGRACSHNGHVLQRSKLLTIKLLTQEYCKPRLIKALKSFMAVTTILLISMESLYPN